MITASVMKELKGITMTTFNCVELSSKTVKDFPIPGNSKSKLDKVFIELFLKMFIYQTKFYMQFNSLQPSVAFLYP